MPEVISQLLAPAIIGICGLFVWFMKRLTASVTELNQQMAVFVERVTVIVEHLEDHETRIRRLEDDSRSLN